MDRSPISPHTAMDSSVTNVQKNTEEATSETPVSDSHGVGGHYWSGNVDFYGIFVSQNIHLIHNISVPTIGIIGIICNVLSIIVMTRKAIRQSSTSVYLTALAVNDTACIIIFFVYIFIWPAGPLGFRAGQMPMVICKLRTAIEVTCLVSAAWLLVCVSAERCVAIWFPLQAKVICTRRNAKIAVGVVFSTLSLLYLVSVFSDGKFIDRCVSTDQLLPSGNSFIFFSTSLYCFIPVPLLCLINGV